MLSAAKVTVIGSMFLVQRVLDHRDPHLLGPPLRPDPQSYSALSDYLLTYSYSTLSCGIISAVVLMLVSSSGWLRAPPLYDAVSFFYFRSHLGQCVCCVVASVSRVRPDVLNADVVSPL